jgi:hypothetical protein
MIEKIKRYIIGGILMITIAAILAFLQIKLFPNTDWSEIDTTPLYWPETFEPYPEPPEDYYMDSVNMDCGE